MNTAHHLNELLDGTKSPPPPIVDNIGNTILIEMQLHPPSLPPIKPTFFETPPPEPANKKSSDTISSDPYFYTEEEKNTLHKMNKDKEKNCQSVNIPKY